MPLWLGKPADRRRAWRGRGRSRGGLGDHVARIGAVLWIGLGERRTGRSLVCRLVLGKARLSTA